MTAVLNDVELSSTSSRAHAPTSRVVETDPFALLFEEHAGFVSRALRRLGVPDSDVEDALQEVFLIAQSRLGDIAPGNEKAFLFGTARRRASTWRRSRDRASRRIEIAHEGAPDMEPGPDSEERTNERHARAVLDEVLDALPFDLRTVLVLHELEEMDIAEMAELLAIPTGTVGSRLRRAREKFEVEAHRVRTRLELEDRS